jgi:hypothetical protein
MVNVQDRPPAALSLTQQQPPAAGIFGYLRPRIAAPQHDTLQTNITANSKKSVFTAIFG